MGILIRTNSQFIILSWTCMSDAVDLLPSFPVHMNCFCHFLLVDLLLWLCSSQGKPSLNVEGSSKGACTLMWSISKFLEEKRAFSDCLRMAVLLTWKVRQNCIEIMWPWGGILRTQDYFYSCLYWSRFLMQNHRGSWNIILTSWSLAMYFSSCIACCKLEIMWKLLQMYFCLVCTCELFCFPVIPSHVPSLQSP